jgi:hypothetical protein
MRRDLNAEPAIEHRVELIETMLEIQGVAPNAPYVHYLARKLGDCAPPPTETKKSPHPWFSLAVISRAIDEVLETLRPEGGVGTPIAFNSAAIFPRSPISAVRDLRVRG